MQRVTITIDNELASELDRLTASRGYQNRSEAIRDLTRAGIKALDADRQTGGDCVAALVYVYAHHARELSKRLTQRFHEHHDLTLSAMHVHLDHESCMEVAVLRGPTDEVEHLASHVIAERGVRHGRLVSVPVKLEDKKHRHGIEPSHRHLHVHVRDG
jgi:CopG family nickel-responsive transcriptional regulator